MDIVLNNKIVNLFFNLTRNNLDVKVLFIDILESIKQGVIQNPENPDTASYTILIFRMIGYTRDIVYGKGERDISYMMVYQFYQYFPIPAMFCLYTFTTSIHDNHIIPFGSWKDIPNLCEYVKYASPVKENDEIITIIISIMNNQLDKDRSAWNTALYEYITEKKKNPMTLMIRPNGRDIMSFAAKWVPREKSKYGWLYEKMVIQWYSSIYPAMLSSAKTTEKYDSAILKCKMNYRKMVSALNKELDTVEVKQCSHKWSEINPENVPNNTLYKQKKAFLNINSNMQPRLDTMFSDDRVKCSLNFKNYLNEKSKTVIHESISQSGTVMTFDISVMEKCAISLCLKMNDPEIIDKKAIDLQIQFLNSQWEKYTKDIVPTNFIPVICKNAFLDNGASPFLGLSCLIAKVSKRVMIMSDNPIWVELSDCPDFFSMVNKIYHSFCGPISDIASNIDNIFELFSKALHHENSSMLPESESRIITEEKIKIIFLSNQDIYSHINNALPIETKLKIIYWNLSNCIINPCENGLLVVSGVSKSILKHIINFDFDDNYSMICHILDHSRYDVLGSHLESLFNA